MSEGLVTISYIAATILFIKSLGGLSNPESSRQGNYFGIAGMTIAILATVFGPQITGISSLLTILICMSIGGSVGVFAAIKVKMTEMPELVALMHSLVGLAAVLVGYANYIDPTTGFVGVERTIHEVEIYVGILMRLVFFPK